MSVIAMIRFDAPAKAVEEMAGRDTDHMLEHLAEVGRSKGAIHHQFLEAEDGSVMVVDEWESEQAFHDFFDHEAEIGKLMEQAGVTSPPEAHFYRILPVNDRF